MVKTPEREGLKLAPSPGNAKRKTSSEPATPMMSVAKMMLRMYCALVKGPMRILFEHSVLPVEPELGPCVCASVDDRQRHGTGGEEQRVADDPTVPEIGRASCRGRG